MNGERERKKESISYTWNQSVCFQKLLQLVRMKSMVLNKLCRVWCISVEPSICSMCPRLMEMTSASTDHSSHCTKSPIRKVYAWIQWIHFYGRQVHKASHNNNQLKESLEGSMRHLAACAKDVFFFFLTTVCRPTIAPHYHTRTGCRALKYSYCCPLRASCLLCFVFNHSESKL